MSRDYFGAVAADLSSTARSRAIDGLNPQTYAVPAYRGKGRAETLVGSGILLKIGAAKFFCTAAHVFDALSRTPLVLNGQGPAHLVKTQAHVTQLPPSGRNDDKYDLLIDRFGVDRAQWFSEDRFIALARVNQNEIPDHRKLLYTFAGYPASANRRGRTGDARLACYTDGPLSPELYEEFGFVPNMHLIIGYNRKQMTNRAGTVVTPTDPHGISGGPVWRLGRLSAIERGTHTPQFIGIGLEYRAGALIALRLSFILETIRSLHPDVAPSIPRSEWIGVNATTQPR